MNGQNSKWQEVQGALSYQLFSNLTGGQPSVVLSIMYLSAINREVFFKSLQLENADCSSLLAQFAILTPLSAGWFCVLKLFPALIRYSKISESQTFPEEQRNAETQNWTGQWTGEYRMRMVFFPGSNMAAGIFFSISIFLLSWERNRKPVLWG